MDSPKSPSSKDDGDRERGTMSELYAVIPDDYDVIVTSFEQGKKAGEFECTLRLPIFDKENALNWLHYFEEKSLTTWRVDRTHKEQTQKLIFKKEYHCQHNTKPRGTAKAHEKHSNCPAKLTVTVRPMMKRSKDIYNGTHPCQVNLRYIHNHDIGTPDVLKYRTPTEDVRRRFEELLMQDLSPSAALRVYKHELRLKFGDDYPKAVSDGALCPKLKWVYDLYNKNFKDDESLASIEKCFSQPVEDHSFFSEASVSEDMIEDVVSVQSSPQDTPSEDVRRTFEDLFMQNHSPSSALQIYKQNLRLKFGDDYSKAASDGVICPTQKWVNDLYYDIFEEEYSDRDDDETSASVEDDSFFNETSSSEDLFDDTQSEQSISFYKKPELDILNVQEKLKAVFHDINELLIDNPAVYAEPVNKFIERFNNCKTDTARVSALSTFGKYNSMPQKSEGKDLQGGKIITVKPTVYGAKRMKVGSRYISKNGKTLKTSLQSKNGYMKRTLEKCNLLEMHNERTTKPHFISVFLDKSSQEN